MHTVTVSNKGQVVIPAELRRKLGITAGTQLEFVEEGTTLRVAVKRRAEPSRLEDGYGMFVYEGEPHRLGDFDVAEAMRRERDR